VSGPFGRDALDGIPDCNREQYIKARARLMDEWDGDDLAAMVIGTTAADLPLRLRDRGAS
jgi:hypothetical protein